MWEFHNGWGWWMVFGWFWMIAFWGLIIWGVWTLVTRLGERQSVSEPPAADPSAREILARRYARGEISSEEFDAMRAHLAGTDAAASVPNGAAQRAGTQP